MFLLISRRTFEMAAKKGKMPFRNDHKSVNRNKKKDLDAQLQAFLNDESAQGIKHSEINVAYLRI